MIAGLPFNTGQQLIFNLIITLNFIYNIWTLNVTKTDETTTTKIVSSK